MKCLILAAGYATRLYPLTENFPKPLLQVGEKSILDWLVDDLVETTDIDEFVVISNHKFAQHFESWKENKESTPMPSAARNPSPRWRWARASTEPAWWATSEKCPTC